MSDLGRQLARMMWWHRLAFYPVVAVMLAVALEMAALAALSLTSQGSGRTGFITRALDFSRLLLIVITVVAALAIGVCWAVSLWHIFWAGKMAFGAWSGLVYTWLAFVLSPWPGLYVIPHMVRLDVKRLLGVDSDDPKANPAEPSAAADGGP